jgi:hypothetical protein
LLLKVIAVAALAIAIAVAVFVFAMPKQSEPGALNVKFTEFTPEKTDIKVGESTKVVFNVQNLEERSINGSKVMIVIEPSGYQPYLSISNPIVELPVMQGKDARTGQIQIVITATSSPAKEAVYTVKGVLLADGKQTDVRDFDLKISQQ